MVFPEETYVTLLLANPAPFIMQNKSVRISRIYLDNENPRHDPINNEPEIIAHLIATENIKPLARDIAEKGRLSPLNRLGLAPHPIVKNAYITAEGNRRICALKLLADPDKASTEADKKYFHRLSAKLETTLDEVDSVIFPTLEAARPWVSLRHEGEQGGVGTLAWDSGQVARFNAKGTSKTVNPNIQASLLIDYARVNGLLPAEQIDKLSITTLTRYLSNPVFRDAIGLSDNRTLTIVVPQEEFDRAVRRFLSDATSDDSGVSSRTSVADRKAYANQLRTEGDAPGTRGEPPVDLMQSPALPTAPVQETAAQTKVAVKRNNRSPNNRKHVIPSQFAVHIKDSILKRLYDELREIDVGFTFAATYLTRAVIERTVTLALTQSGTAAPPELHAKLQKVIPLLEADGMGERELKVFRKMATDRESRYSPDSIGHFVHGGEVPTKEAVIALWDSIEHIMRALFGRLR
jgi:hypothetical protein